MARVQLLQRLAGGRLVGASKRLGAGVEDDASTPRLHDDAARLNDDGAAIFVPIAPAADAAVKPRAVTSDAATPEAGPGVAAAGATAADMSPLVAAAGVDATPTLATVAATKTVTAGATGRDLGAALQAA